jgi:hypothetical protein
VHAIFHFAANFKIALFTNNGNGTDNFQNDTGVDDPFVPIPSIYPNIGISSTASSFLISDPENGEGNGGRILDSDISNYLQNVGALRIFTDGDGDITMFEDSIISWSSDSPFQLDCPDGSMFLNGTIISSTLNRRRLSRHGNVGPGKVQIFSDDTGTFPGSHSGSPGSHDGRRLSRHGNVGTSSGFTLEAPDVEIDVGDSFTHRGQIRARRDVTVIAQEEVVVNGGGIAAGETVAIITGALIVEEGGSITGETVSITADSMDMSGSGTIDASCGMVNINGDITDLDTDPPVITCPDVTVFVDAGVTETAVDFQVTATDKCTIAMVQTSVISGSTFGMGTTTVDATATDFAGNVDTCTFAVTVITGSL